MEQQQLVRSYVKFLGLWNKVVAHLELQGSEAHRFETTSLKQ
jgi:hypothetical protein